MKKLLLLIAAVASFASCVQNIEGVDTSLGYTTITVGMPESRTSLGDKDANGIYAIYWSDGDKIVANGAASSRMDIGDNKKSATFHFEGSLLVPPYHLTYPYTANSACAEGKPTVVFAAEQEYVEGSFGVGYAPMCGYIESGEASMQHLAGVLQFTVKGANKLSKIEIIAEEGKALAGEFDVDCESGTLTAIESTATNKITYTANQTLTADGTAFHITVPKGIEGVCKVVLTDSAGQKMNLKWTASNVSAGVVREFTPFTFKGGASFELQEMTSITDEMEVEAPDTWKIYYTATAKVEPYKTDVFGANIESNEWDEATGEGVITFDGKIFSIGKEAFSRNKQLTGITIPNSVISIGYDSFLDCDNIVKINIPESVSLIDTFAFLDCDGLTEVILQGKTDIGDEAFAYCDKLSNVFCKSITPSIIGKNVFFYCPIHIYVPESYDNSVINNYKSANGWKDYALSIQEYDFDNDVSISKINKIRYSATEKITPYATDVFGVNILSNEWDSTTGDGVITFDGNITSIGDKAFYNCSSLTKITIPASVTYIGDEAFYCCSSLTRFTIPANVSQIGKNVFSGCGAKELIVNSKLIETNYTYDECPANNSTHWLRGSHFTDISFGDNITKIGDFAFCKYTTYSSWEINITLPTSITYIGNMAFAHCNIYNISSDCSNVQFIGEGAFYQSHFNYENYIKLCFSDKLKYIGEHAFAYSDIDAIYLNSITPPTLVLSSSYNESPFIGFDEDSNYVDPACDIYIPQGSQSNYLNSDWRPISYYLNEYQF